METDEKSSLKFMVSTIQVVGKVTAEFRVCQTTLQDCTDETLYEKSSTLIQTKKHDHIAEKRVFDIEIEDSYLRQINEA
jgi:hypothetical protein